MRAGEGVTQQGSPTIGFVGLGTMGRGMAVRLIEAGFDVTVLDIDTAVVDRLAAGGATRGHSLEALGHDCDIISIAAVNDQQVLDIVGVPEERGLLARARPATILVVHSTIDPAVCRDLAATAATRGVVVLDAPMTGSPDAAAEGRLSLMVGGDPAALEVARPALESFASTITHLGPVGSGQTAKIANNLAISVTVVAVHEALKLADSCGIGADRMLPLLATGGADSWVARNWRAIGGTASAYPGGAAGLGSLARKDASLALALADKEDVPLPAAAMASQLMADAYRAAYAHAISMDASPADNHQS